MEFKIYTDISALGIIGELPWEARKVEICPVQKLSSTDVFLKTIWGLG